MARDKHRWLPTPEEQARIDAHWAEVRAGLRKDTPHEFGTDAKSSIAAHRFRAQLLIKEAARHARLAMEMAEAQ